MNLHWWIELFSTDNLIQLGILLTGCSSVLLLGVPQSWQGWQRWKRWAPVLGLISQPLWFLMAYRHDGMWGLSVLNVAYTASWMHGVWLNWGTPILAQRARKRIALKVENPSLL